jgi:rubrerythrin
MIVEPPDPPNNLGYANSWEKTPEIVIHCKEKNHAREIKTVASCVTQYICRECGYVYKVDSGD